MTTAKGAPPRSQDRATGQDHATSQDRATGQDRAVSPDTLDFVEEYVALAERFAVGVAGTMLSSPVPACPGWSAYDLVTHLGNVHAWAATIVETGRPAKEQFDEPASRKPTAVSQWYAGKAEDLYEVLRASAPGEECWNFAGINLTKAFWPRRQTHETLVHLVDLDQSAGRTTYLQPRLCADAVAEALSVFLVRMHDRGHPTDLVAPLTIRCTDTSHVWTLTPREGGPPLVAVRTEPGADLVEGPADALTQLLWKRCRPDHPDVSLVGNRNRINAFLGSRLTA